jgi:hypothetical protein
MKSWSQRMAEPVKHEGGTAGFEPQDLSSHAVYVFLGGLAAGAILVALVLWGLYHAMDGFERRHQPQQSPLVLQTQADTREVSPDEISTFPQPRLEKNERLEINQFLLREEQSLDSYGWVDQKAGVVRIPIERAMQLIAQRGLPTTPKAGSVPPSEVDVVNQTAQGADAGNRPPAKGKKQR